MTTRVARWSAPVGEHSVSERPRLTVSRPERARRRSTVDVTNGFGGHALPVLASGYLSRPVRSAGGPLCGRRRRPRLCGGSTSAAAARRPRTGRARADGERRRHRVCPSASYAVAPARFKESLELVSTAHDRAGARPAAFRLRDGRPPGRRFSVSVHHPYWYVSECERAVRPIASSSSYDKPINTLGGGSLGSCVDEERSQLR